MKTKSVHRPTVQLTPPHGVVLQSLHRPTVYESETASPHGVVSALFDPSLHRPTVTLKVLPGRCDDSRAVRSCSPALDSRLWHHGGYRIAAISACSIEIRAGSKLHAASRRHRDMPAFVRSASASKADAIAWNESCTNRSPNPTEPAGLWKPLRGACAFAPASIPDTRRPLTQRFFSGGSFWPKTGFLRKNGELRNAQGSTEAQAWEAPTDAPAAAEGSRHTASGPREVTRADLRPRTRRSTLAPTA